MENVSQELMNVLVHLLPGFLVSWVVYGLTSYPKPGQFERVVQALIFSFIVGALVAVAEWVFKYFGVWVSVGVWDQNANIVSSSVIAVVLGLVISYFSNNDYFYSVARKVGLTNRTAYPSEW